MDPNPKNFPILSYVMAKLPAVKRSFSGAPADFDVENPADPEPKPQEPHFELTERMPHLKNPKLISAMRRAVTDVAKTRSVLEILGTRPDHEAVDAARFRLSELKAQSSGDVKEGNEDYKICEAVITLDEMHEAYERMLSEGRGSWRGFTRRRWRGMS
ncbi:UNVERIFIED_CONTAM: Plant intracellular Ras-group-related LRR protein 9 [Sesamum angustifolium]|uniref:Plant intracellular Ras-group-related LRR protein 9 n=1 Tax=Sesamum angustifolium TaxID=2727405 RepID=A0AAW2LGW0_9LAMI